MKVLIVGTGVIGTLYGAQLGMAGHEIAVLEHGADRRRQEAWTAHDIIRNDSVTIQESFHTI
jgi:2-polyprenyl-6-methoxyphenol hydroxylase-like FAD-dependent oxidoreductase